MCYRVKLQGRDAPGKIFLPLIIIEYGEMTKNEITPNKHVLVEYKVIFIMAKDRLKNALQVINLNIRFYTFFLFFLYIN